MSQIKILMVDMDGVVIRDEIPWHANLERDTGVSYQQLHEHFFTKSWNEVIIGKADLHEQISKVLNQIGAEISAKELIDYWLDSDSRTDTALLSLLCQAQAQGMQIHSATNQEHTRARYLLETLGLQKIMSDFHYSAALGCRKPDLTYFRLITEKTGLRAGEHLLIDDNQENIETAKSFGWNVLAWDASPAAFSKLRELAGL